MKTQCIVVLVFAALTVASLFACATFAVIAAMTEDSRYWSVALVMFFLGATNLAFTALVSTAEPHDYHARRDS